MTDASTPTPLVVRGVTDVRSMREILWPAFREAVAEASELDYRQIVDMASLRAEILATDREHRPDVIVPADPLPFARDGLLRPLVDVDQIKRPAHWEDAARRWLSIYVQPIVATYNALYAQPPRSWVALADEGWRDRLVVEAPSQIFTTGPAFAELKASMGEGPWTAWLERLSANGVRQVGDNERAVLEVATGERWVGLSNWNVARRVRPGSPARYVFLNPTPIVPGFVAVVDGGRSPDLGERFAGWLAAAPGQAAIARTGRITVAELMAPSRFLASQIPPAVELVYGTTDWLQDPVGWASQFRRYFPEETELGAGKLRT